MLGHPAAAEQHGVTWALADGTFDGKPMVYRLIEAPPAGIELPDFPTVLVITWNYEPDGPNGMPDERTHEAQGRLEDLIYPALTSGRGAYLVLVMTGTGFKRWHWYIRDTTASMSLLNRALDGYERFPIRITTMQDPDWRLFWDVRRSIKLRSD